MSVVGTWHAGMRSDLEETLGVTTSMNHILASEQEYTRAEKMSDETVRV